MLAIVAAAVAGLSLTAAVYVYVASERLIRRTYDVPLTDLTIPGDSASIAEGRRLALIRGCQGCHGETLGGEVFADDFMTGRAVAPNLTRVAREYSISELARVIRYGVRPNGEGVQIMPSPMYYHLSDADLGRIIAFLRSAPTVDGAGYEFRPGPATRWEMARGEWLPWPEDILLMGARMPAPNPDDTIRYGEYLAQTACTECHGNDLTGGDGGSTPDLRIAAAYSPHDFARLMQTGVATGERELGLMTIVSRGRFSHFTDLEIRALYAFLRARAGVGNGS